MPAEHQNDDQPNTGQGRRRGSQERKSGDREILTRVGTEHWSLLEAMLQRYLTELSAWSGEKPDEDGRFLYPFLAHYQHEPDRQVFFINPLPENSSTRSPNQPIGFAMVRAETDPATGVLVREIVEFYVDPDCRRSGIGQAGVRELLKCFPGEWQLGVLPGNTRALHFWRQAISALCGSFDEQQPTGPRNGQIRFRFGTTTTR